MNSHLLEFIEFEPYQANKVKEPSSDNDLEILDEPSSTSPSFSLVFFNEASFPIGKEEIEISQKSHQIRLNQQLKPKKYYSFNVLFKKSGAMIELEKLYGDYKKMHEFIKLTFQNEINEY